MICKNCGKECPDQKYCIFCGALLEDPNQFFKGLKFSTVDECNSVKHDYETMTQKFQASDVSYTPEEIGSAIEEYQQSNFHPAAIQLATSFLNPIIEDLRYQRKKKKRSWKIRFLAVLYIVAVVLLSCTQPLVRVGGSWCTLPDMIKLLIPGKLGLTTWLWNTFVTVVVLFAILLSVYLCFKKSEAMWASSAPFIIPLFFFPLLILTLIPSIFFKVDYDYSELFTALILAGLIWGLICTVLMPSKPKTRSETSAEVEAE